MNGRIRVGAVALLLALTGTARDAAVREAEKASLASDSRPPELRTADLAKYSTNRLDFALNNGLAMTRGGRIWASWISGGDGPGSFTAASWSDDGGKTWTDTRLVIDGHDGTDAERTNIIGTFWLDPDGKLRCYTDQSLLHFDGRAGVWESVCENPDDANPVWSAARRIGNGHAINKPIVLANGDWALAAYLNGTWKTTPGSVFGAFPELDAERGATCFVSTDRGKTWEKRGTVKLPSEDRAYGKVEDWQESQLVELKDGTLRMFARVVDGTIGGLMAADSKDGGRTFSPARRLASMDNANARFQIQRLASGRLIFVKHGLPDGFATAWHGRRQLTAYLSDDDGASWQGGLVLDWGVGSYPDLFQAPDGTIYVSHDHGRYTNAEIWLHRFTEEDVLARRIVSGGGFRGRLVMRAMNSPYNRTSAAVELGAPFADGMVLQRGKPVPVWGWAEPSSCVTVLFAGQTVETTAGTNGEWRVNLAPLAASLEGEDLVVTSCNPTIEQSHNRTILRDVLVGEVWICSGQSNMEAPLCNTHLHFADMKGALRAQMTRKPLVRYCLSPRQRIAPAPQRRLARRAEWKTFEPANLGPDSFSAVGFHFALELHNALGVPVGIVGAYWGGTPIVAWTPEGALKRIPTKWNEKDARDNFKPSVIFNAQVAPFTPMSLRGFIWYQGETDSWRGHDYRTDLKALYAGWAEAFGDPSLKMRFAQLAPAGGVCLAPIMEGQEAFAKEEPNAEMAVICDRGAVHDWHPNDKEPVGMRLAALALRHDYGFTDLKADAPSLKSWTIEDGRFVLSFDNAEGWLLYNEDWSNDNCFEVAGADGVWHPAEIENLKVREKKPYASNGIVVGRDLVVSSSAVKEPKRLRYLYRAPFKSNLFNEAGLPLGPLHVARP